MEIQISKSKLMFHLVGGVKYMCVKQVEGGQKKLEIETSIARRWVGLQTL